MSAPLDASESPAAGGAVRRYTPEDRAAVLALLGTARPTVEPNHHVHVSPDGAGAAVWIQPAAGELAYLGPVVTNPPNRQLFYELVHACVSEIISEGFQRGYLIVRDHTILRLIQRDFDVTSQVYGRNGATQEPTSWRIEVDLADALQQLDARLA